MPNLTITVHADADLQVLSSLRRIAGVAPSSLGCPVDAADLMLLVTEVAANAVEAGADHLDLVFERVTAAKVRVSVLDDAAGDPVLQRPGPEDEGGRGLLIVDRLSCDWGVDRSHERGTTLVWFDLGAPVVVDPVG